MYSVRKREFAPLQRSNRTPGGNERIVADETELGAVHPIRKPTESHQPVFIQLLNTATSLPGTYTERCRLSHPTLNTATFFVGYI